MSYYYDTIPEYYTLETPKMVKSKKLVLKILLAIGIISIYMMMYILSNQDVYQHLVGLVSIFR